MSLRAFHICFITIVTLFFVAAAVWAFVFAPASSEATMKIIGGISIAVAVLLPIYGTRFLAKTRDLLS